VPARCANATDVDAPRGVLRAAHYVALALIALVNAAFLAIVVADVVAAPPQSFTPTRPPVESPLKNHAWQTPRALA
jgi:hypothetical protein